MTSRDLVANTTSNVVLFRTKDINDSFTISLTVYLFLPVTFNSSLEQMRKAFPKSRCTEECRR